MRTIPAPSPRSTPSPYIQHSGRSPNGLAAQIENFRGIFGRMPDVQARVGGQDHRRRPRGGAHELLRDAYPAAAGHRSHRQALHARTIDIWRVENGKFAEHWDIVDFPGLQQQLRGEQ
jgi:predicted SnoaL-like aldol condensation-catalyzing enzyme